MVCVYGGGGSAVIENCAYSIPAHIAEAQVTVLMNESSFVADRYDAVPPLVAA